MKMRKVPKRFLAFGMLICMIVSLFPATALAGTSTRAGGAEYQLTDEWENRSPVENAIEFEGTDKVTFHALPGELGMYTNAQNVLLYDAPAGDFTAAVKVTNTALTSDYQTIGLAAFASESRVAGTMRRYHSGLGGNVFAKMNYNGNYDEYAVADTDTDAPVWLKLERSGSEFIHSYSYDGTEFTEISRTTDNADLFACDDLKIAIYTGGADTFDATVQDFTVNGESVPFCTEKIVEEDEYELTRDWTIHSPVEGKLRVDDENRVIFHSQQGELGQITDAKNVLLYDMPDGDFTATVKVTNTELTSDYQTIGLAAFEDIYADYGTSLEELNLPETAEVTLEDGALKEQAVTRDPQRYDPQTAGTQTVKGTLELEKYVINSEGKQAEIKVHVMEEGQGIPVTKITLDRTDVTLALEGAVTLNAEVFPDNAADKTVVWESSDDGVAAVDSAGKITAVSKGTAAITARSGDASAQCTVTVTDGIGIGTVWGVPSPDSEVQIAVKMTEDYDLVYEAAKNGKAFITDGSVLGLKTNTIDTTKDLTFKPAETDIQRQYRAVFLFRDRKGL